MSSKTKTILQSLIVISLFGISLQALAVWTNPSGVAPANNTQPPINTSLTGQKKDGAFIAGGLRSDTSVIGVENALFGALDIPAASSVLELRSTAKGFLPPRMTMVQRNAIASPAAGLLIYQTDNAPGFYYFDGTNWLSIGSGGNGGGSGGSGIGGSGTPNSVAKWTAAGTLGDSSITDNGTLITTGSDLKISGELYFNSIDLAVNQTNAPELNLQNANVVFISLDSSKPSSTIQCLKSDTHGRLVFLINKSTTDTFILKNMDAGCNDTGIQTASGTDLSLVPYQTIGLIYDVSFSKWRHVVGP